MKKVLLILLASCSIAAAASDNDRVWVSFGVKGEGGFGMGSNIGSKAFDGRYNYLGRDSSTLGGGGLVGGGVALGIFFTKSVGLYTEFSYRGLFISTDMMFEGDKIKFSTQDHAISVPVLLRLGEATEKGDGFFFGVGVQYGVPFSSNAKVTSDRFGINDRHADSVFRAKHDLGIVIAFGPSFKLNGGAGWFMWKIVAPITYLDKYRGMTFPGTLSLSIDVPIFGF